MVVLSGFASYFRCPRLNEWASEMSSYTYLYNAKIRCLFLYDCLLYEPLKGAIVQSDISQGDGVTLGGVPFLT